ncbi:hypothetical protein [Paludisphaera borealis]|uniref:Carboxypeptidase regulatory-like domain-containing protein n=1 Tax=Paludisphaera borealis TaxID=1387353 RepID=A0A1U7CTF5_9BACT|nr:hypothetical protein [Paludisphaera borealis]APW62163.1 hypothetical protein BSF38_03695 [Paludisphaera borealis]
MIRSFTLRCGLLGLTFAVANGCDGGGADGRHRVYGKVTLDGVPLAKGVIAFDPAPGGGATVTTGGVVVDGAYLIAGEDGPTAGKYRVSIRSGGGETADAKSAPGMPPSLKAAKGDPIPKKYNAESILTADVGASGSTEANYELTSQ